MKTINFKKMENIMKNMISSLLTMLFPVEQPELIEYDSKLFIPSRDEFFVPSAVLIQIMKNPNEYMDICKFS